MTEQAALQAAILADPDDDTARLAYADWLDENKPDRVPSPAAGASARAEFIRVQCRLATGAFADPDYPELLEREADLATWLNTHDPDEDTDLSGLCCTGEFEGGQWGGYRRGFQEVMKFEFGDYQEDVGATVDQIVSAIEDAFGQCPARTLWLEDAMPEEIVLLARQPVFGRLLGLCLDSLGGGGEDEAVAAIAESPRSVGLRRLYFDFSIGEDGFAALARSHYLSGLESLVLDFPPAGMTVAKTARAIKALGRAKWFRNLRRLHLCLRNGDTIGAVGDLPPMPRLLSVTLSGEADGSPAALRRFASSRAFPNLAHLDLSNTRLAADHIELLARGQWPLRHLQLARNEIRKVGAEALTSAAFAPTLRVLDLRGCAISAGGVQALAESDALAGLRHLDLAENPVGPGGLEALASTLHLRGLRALDLGWTNSARGPIGARDVAVFLTALDMPRLRHLTLDQLPVGVRGAKVIATNPAFANLTRLDLVGCALGEAGTKAVVGSKTLANLVALDLSENKVGGGAGKLASRNVFPRLAHCLLGTGVPRTTATRLRRRPGVSV